MGLLIATKRFVAGLLLASAFNCGPACAWEGSVTETPDGDSLRVEKEGRVYEIRLYGIDSPEYGQSFWREAKGLTRALILGKTVTIETLDRDRYGREVALVRNQGQLVNSELVRNGLAWVYPRYCQRQPLCSDMKYLEEAARKQGIGLWREKAPLAPWLWRQLKR